MLKIYTSSRYSAEKAYTFGVMLREMLGIDFQLLFEEAEPHHRLCLPNGAILVLENHFWKAGTTYHAPQPDSIPGVVPHPFIPGENIIGIFGRPTFIRENQHLACGLDLLASTFFMLSRWEENAPAALDQHGRFPAEQSLAFKANFLQRPVVNEWVDLLWEMLLQLGWQQPRPARKYRLSISCDVDHPRLWWTPADRLRTLGGAIFKRGDFPEALYFLKNHLFSAKDPYDVFDEWMDLFEKYNHTAQFNFLGKRPRSSDCWYPIEHPFIQRLMEKIDRRGHKIGFHPSYEAFENQDVFAQELASLKAVSPAAITSGRQHYLRFAVPQTWKTWAAAGLLADSTLGYPEAEGFRCGICHDFPVFDIVGREALSLREYPLLAMDVTLAQYREYRPEQAAEKLSSLEASVKKHKGNFTLLWHNSSWNTPFWEPWKKVFVDIIATQ